MPEDLLSIVRSSKYCPFDILSSAPQLYCYYKYHIGSFSGYFLYDKRPHFQAESVVVCDQIRYKTYYYLKEHTLCTLLNKSMPSYSMYNSATVNPHK